MAFKFENLEVWNKAIDLATDIHYLTRKWPKEEMFNLTSQIKRAADSVALNLAEGSTGNTNPEFRRFCGIANRSGIEVVSCLHLAIRRDLINQKEFNEMYMQMTVLIRMIQGLKKSL